MSWFLVTKEDGSSFKLFGTDYENVVANVPPGAEVTPFEPEQTPAPEE